MIPFFKQKQMYWGIFLQMISVLNVCISSKNLSYIPEIQQNRKLKKTVLREEQKTVLNQITRSFKEQRNENTELLKQYLLSPSPKKGCSHNKNNSSNKENENVKYNLDRDQEEKRENSRSNPFKDISNNEHKVCSKNESLKERKQSFELTLTTKIESIQRKCSFDMLMDGEDQFLETYLKAQRRIVNNQTKHIRELEGLNIKKDKIINEQNEIIKQLEINNENQDDEIIKLEEYNKYQNDKIANQFDEIQNLELNNRDKITKLEQQYLTEEIRLQQKLEEQENNFINELQIIKKTLSMLQHELQEQKGNFKNELNTFKQQYSEKIMIISNEITKVNSEYLELQTNLKQKENELYKLQEMYQEEDKLKEQLQEKEVQNMKLECNIKDIHEQYIEKIQILEEHIQSLNEELEQLQSNKAILLSEDLAEEKEQEYLQKEQALEINNENQAAEIIKLNLQNQNKDQIMINQIQLFQSKEQKYKALFIIFGILMMTTCILLLTSIIYLKIKLRKQKIHRHTQNSKIKRCSKQ